MTTSKRSAAAAKRALRYSQDPAYRLAVNQQLRSRRKVPGAKPAVEKEQRNE